MLDLFWSHRRPDAVGDYASTSADQAQSYARKAEESARDANERLDQLLLVCSAMWELLREKTSLTDADLVTRVAEIDARDGTADDKMTHSPQKCLQCQRTIFPKHRRCLYCGAPVRIDDIFKTI